MAGPDEQRIRDQAAEAFIASQSSPTPSSEGSPSNPPSHSPEYASVDTRASHAPSYFYSDWQAGAGGLLRGDPSGLTEDVVNSLGIEAGVAAAQWENKYKADIARNPGVRFEFDDDQQKVYRVVEEAVPGAVSWELAYDENGRIRYDESGEPIRTQVQDGSGTRTNLVEEPSLSYAYRQFLQFDADRKRADQWLTDFDFPEGVGEGVTGTGMSYARSEGQKSDEVERQYRDAIMRIEDSYGLRGDELQYVRDAISATEEAREAAASGFYGGPIAFGSNIGARPYSKMVESTIPQYLRPDYRQNESVGLPGPQGFDNPNFNAAGFPLGGGGRENRDFILPRFAEGTAVSERPRLPDEEIPDEFKDEKGRRDMRGKGLAWMIGLPAVPRRSNIDDTLFTPYNGPRDALRGDAPMHPQLVRLRQMADQAEATKGMMNA